MFLESKGQKVAVTIRSLSTGEIRINPVLETVPERPGFTATVPVSVSGLSYGTLSFLSLMVMVAGQQDLTVREFVFRHFAGLSGSKAGRAVKNCPVKRIRDLVFLEEKEGREAALDVCRDLLFAMKELSRPMKPAKLGSLGKENLVARLKQLFSVEKEGRYVKKEGFAEGKPFVVEVYYVSAGGARILTGLNFSGTYKCYLMTALWVPAGGYMDT